MYEKCFQLRRDPFADAVDAALFFRGSGAERAFGFLERALSGASEALLVIGEPGLGKSALLSRFAASVAMRAEVERTSAGPAQGAGTRSESRPEAAAATSPQERGEAAALESSADDEEFALFAEESEEQGADPVATAAPESAGDAGAMDVGPSDEFPAKAAAPGCVRAVLVPAGAGDEPLARAIARELGRFAAPDAGKTEGEASGSVLSPSGEELPAAIDKLGALRRVADDRLLLLIDDADRLSDETLRALARLLGGGEGRFGLVLAGLPGLSPRLAALREPHFSRAAKGVFRLFPLSRQESEEYVRRRLRAAGSAEELFSRGALDLAHMYSGGVPGRLSLLCREALLYACAEDASGVDADLVGRVVADGLPGLANASLAKPAAPETEKDFAFVAEEPVEDFDFEVEGEQPEPTAEVGAIEERLRAIESRLESMQALLDRLVGRLDAGKPH